MYRYELRKGDLRSIERILSSSGFFSEEEIEIGCSLVTERLEKGQESGYYFILLEEREELVGFSCYGPIPGTKDSYDLYWIAIDPKKRFRGFGSEMIRKTEELIARDQGRRVFVETSSTSQYEPTRRFYESQGYRCCAFYRDFYDMNNSKVVYEKLLCC